MNHIVVDLNPVIFSLGFLQVRWYGLMYVIGFILGSFLLKKLVDKGLFKTTKDKVDNLITYSIIGMFICARLFYVLIYNWDQYIKEPIKIFYVWEGGLSFHGGLFGFTAACFFFSRKYKVPMLHILDVSVICASQGLFFGRIGNFINGELYGRITESPIGMIFTGGGPYPRHPSQLYEAIFEGLILFIILWSLKSKLSIPGFLTAIFLMGYGLFRYSIEFFREPDTQMGYYLGGTTTMGQILCLIMIIIGLIFLFFSLKNRKKNETLLV